MEITKEIITAHERLARCNSKFIEFITKSDKKIDRTNFNFLYSDDQFNNCRNQPWPTFINQDTKNQFVDAATGIFNLIKSIPERILDYNPTEIAQYYGFKEDEVEQMFYGSDFDTLESLWGRGDFIILPTQEIKCINFNVSSNSGGWEMDMLTQHYVNIPVISEFLKNSNAQLKNDSFFSTLLETTLEKALNKFQQNSISEINIAFASSDFQNLKQKGFEKKLNRMYENRLNQKNNQLKGKIYFCDYNQLTTNNNYITIEETPIHVLIELYEGQVPLFVLDAAEEERLLVINGPISSILNSKLNIALLSETQDSEIFSPDEKETIRKYIPWTRKVLPGSTHYKMEKVDLEEFIKSNRKHLVLKSIHSIESEKIFLGLSTSPELWHKKLQLALSEKNWIVQEYIPSQPYLYQSDEQENGLCNAIWKHFIFGETYGGGKVRILPQEKIQPISNSNLNAEESIILEVFEDNTIEDNHDIINDKIKKNHEFLSITSVNFLEFVKQNPEGLIRASFKNIDKIEKESMPFQPWPTFISPTRTQYMTEAGVKVFELIKSIPERIFSNDVEKIAKYFRMNQEQIHVALSSISGGHIHNILGRGDFLLSSTGYKCLEYNISGGIGGWHMPVAESAFLDTPILKKFISQYNVKILNNDLIEILVVHLLNSAIEKFINDKNKEINIAFVYYKFSKEGNIGFGEKYLSEIFYRILSEKYSHLQGDVIFCDFPQLTVNDNHIFYKEKKVHVLLESYHGLVPPNILMPAIRGNVLLYNGPVSVLLSNKLNLAVLSENQESTVFTPLEREIIKNHVPWTRRIESEEVTFDRTTFNMKELLLTHQERMILKPGSGSAGNGVTIGAFTGKEQWKKVVEKEIQEKQTVVQEYIDTIPLVYQAGENGYAQYNTVWGLFFFGSVYAGAFLRLLEKKRDTKGVINVFQGAQAGVILEVDR